MSEPAELYFGDVEVGHHMTAGTYLLTREEIVDFASRYDPRPFHIDEAAADAPIFKGLTAAGAHTFAIAQALGFQHQPALVVQAMLGIDEMRLPAPARPGDQLSFSSTLIEKRPSASRPGAGVARYHTVLRNDADTVVLEYKITVLLGGRPKA
ncbi:MAG TPA: MaoC/PaaZ C-terminal domain-containing protein [Caulobacteraceae bacterium]|jgi:acyl dehydratase